MSIVYIFDYDGVIIDSYEIFVTYFLKACEHEHIKDIKTESDFLKLYDKNMYENMFQMGMDKDQILRIVLFMKNSLLNHKQDLNLFPNIKETIQSLAQQIDLYIVTSSDTALVSELLHLHGIDVCFNGIIGSDHEPSKTKKIKTIIQQHPDDDYFYIGDTAGDIIEGKKAGVKTIAVTWGWHEKTRLNKEHPDYLVDHPEELLLIATKITTD